jgi:hypothetical protein
MPKRASRPSPTVKAGLPLAAFAPPKASDVRGAATLRAIARAGLTPSMQRALGNRRVAAVLDATRRPTAADRVLQRREENPYQARGDLGGWDLTAHHVIAHSKLVDALGKLTEQQRRAILAQAIPTNLDADMLLGAGLKLEDDQKDDVTIGALKDRLRNPDDMGIVNNTRLADVRQSFFEWQGGNQFLGPNTSIRTEPSPSKDEMDTDARFLGVANYDELEARGKELYALLGSQETTDQALFTKLQEILTVTRDTRPGAFDVNQWHEITSPAEVEQLASSNILGRDHLTGYAFLKFAVADLSAKYPAIVPTNSGQSEFKYGTVPKIPAHAKGVHGYIQYEDAKTTVPTAKQTTSVREVLTENGVTVAEGSGGSVTATLPQELVAFAKGSTLRLNGYTGLVNFTGRNQDVFTLPQAELDKTLSFNAPGVSLYDYAVGAGMPASSFLPKRLYELLQQQSRLPGLEEELRTTQVNLAKFETVIKDLSTSGWRRRMGTGDRKQQQMLRKSTLDDYKGRAQRARQRKSDLERSVGQIREAGKQIRR